MMRKNLVKKNANRYGTEMHCKIFITFRNLSQEEKGLKKISFEGKDYYGLFASKDTICLEELTSIANDLHQDPSQILLLPLEVFG